MANPIKETPILQGMSSKKFNEDVADQLKYKVSAEEKNRILKTVAEVLSKKNNHNHQIL